LVHNSAATVVDEIRSMPDTSMTRVDWPPSSSSGSLHRRSASPCLRHSSLSDITTCVWHWSPSGTPRRARARRLSKVPIMRPRLPELSCERRREHFAVT
jgi:hypothetical protein